MLCYLLSKRSLHTTTRSTYFGKLVQSKKYCDNASFDKEDTLKKIKVVDIKQDKSLEEKLEQTLTFNTKMKNDSDLDSKVPADYHSKRIFPDGGVVLSMDYEQIKKIYPERFNIKKLPEIFEAWKNTGNFYLPNLDSLKSISSSKQRYAYVRYEYDKLVYKSTIDGIKVH